MRKLMIAVLPLLIAGIAMGQDPSDALSQKVTLRLQNADFQAALQAVTQNTGAQVVFVRSDKPYDKVNVTLIDQPLESAVKFICMAGGAAYRVEPGPVFVVGHSGDPGILGARQSGPEFPYAFSANVQAEKPAEKPAQDTKPAGPQIDMRQKTYTQKPGETVIKWTFKTTFGIMQERGTGDVYTVLDFKNAPETGAHIVDLVKKGFYTGIKVHRIESKEDFAVVQWGNADSKKPKWDQYTESGSGHAVKHEKSPLKHLAGALGLARSTDLDSGDSQVYVCLVAIPKLDEMQYTIFGQVVAGLEVLLYAKQNNTEIVSATVVQEGQDAVDIEKLLAEEATKQMSQAVQFADPTNTLKWHVEDSGLRYAEVKEGTGEPIGTGKTASVQYTGWLTNGVKFDSSRDHADKVPLSFKLGGNQVIRGWEEGVAGMRLGGIRKLIVPPDLGYGAQGSKPLIPPNSILVFEVELAAIK